MSDHVTHAPEVQESESTAQINLISEIGDTFTQMHTATVGLVGTPDWNGAAAHAADELVNNFVTQTSTALDELGEKAKTIVNLAQSSQDNDAQYTQQTLGIDLPTLHT